MASSLISEASKLYYAGSRHLAESLPPALQHHLNHFSTAVDRYVPQFIADSLPTSNLLLVLSLALPSLLLLFMASYSRAGYWPASSGRFSPYSAHGAPPRVSENDFSYLGDDDIGAIGSHAPNSTYTDHSHHHMHHPASAHELIPDILILRHKGTTYPLHFDAFSISEGIVKVGDLRRYAAQETGCNDERRVTLLYKGKPLKDDRRGCRDEGLKQNSEIVCVVSEPLDFYNESTGRRLGQDVSTSESGEDGDPYGSPRGSRVGVDGTAIGGSERRRRKGHRSGRSRKARGGDSKDTSPRASGYLSPRGSGYLHPDPSHANHHGRDPSPTRPTTTAAPPKPSSTPTPRPPSVSDNSPEGKLEAISRTFHTTFVPDCVQYLSNPPSVKKDREFEYKKLSEGILAQVILKLDEVQTEDQAVKARRKELVKETQQMLGRLDEVGKAA